MISFTCVISQIIEGQDGDSNDEDDDYVRIMMNAVTV